MGYFQEDEARPIVSAWVEQGFEIDKGFILEAIELDESALEKDVLISAVAAFGSIGAGCLMLALGGFTAPMLVPVAVLAGSGLIAWNSDCAKGDRELEGKFLRNYPAVFDRLSQKLANGEGVATIAADYGQLFRAYRKSDRAALLQLSATASTETQSQSGIQNSGAGEATRTESQTLAPTELQPIAPSMQHITSPVWNPAQDLGENPQSALIVGVPGSGKGMMVSNAIRVLKERNPNLKVFVIDPKASPKERGYWESIADDYRAFSLKNCEDPDEGAAWLLSCMDAFRRLPGPKLCIFDELMTAATELELADSKLKALPKLKKFVVGLVGQGDSEAEWLWAMTQSPQVKDLGMSGGVRANLRVIGLVSPKNMTAVEALVSTQLIPKPHGGLDELRAIMAASPVGRAVFDGKIARWLPMPKLENHSGFDRDNRSLADEKPTGNLEDVFGEAFLKDHPLLEKDEAWQADEPIEVDAVEVKQSHPLSDKFDRIESLLNGEDVLTVKDIQKKLKLDTSTEAQQLAQMFCMNQKSRYRFGKKANPNGTTSYFIEALA